MKVTHIAHSGFSVELEKTVLVFDYYVGDFPAFDPAAQIVVLASHGHPDHFTKRIWQLLGRYENLEFVLSDDIPEARVQKHFAVLGLDYEAAKAHIHFIGPHQQLEFPGVKIETLLSTDLGVAFVVRTEGKTIYHSGDLHWWVWEGDTEENHREMIDTYTGEIAKIEGLHMDLAFAVLDSRLKDYWQGLDYFMRHTDPAVVIPMHFWEDVDVIDRFLALPCAEEYGSKLLHTGMGGESWEL